MFKTYSMYSKLLSDQVKYSRVVMKLYKNQRVKNVSLPWYPDCSGRWIEIPNSVKTPPNLSEDTEIDVLLLDERYSKAFAGSFSLVRDWIWDAEPNSTGRIVAYKVLK